MTDQYTKSETRYVKSRLDEVNILVTIIDGSIMAAAYTTCESAMAAAVNWVEGEAEIRLSGRLEERFKAARQYVEANGGKMDVIVSPMWSSES